MAEFAAGEDAAERGQGADVVPPVVVGSPSEVPRELDAAITWWRPSWRERARFVGWRWVLLAPALVLIVFLLIGLRSPLAGVVLFAGSVKFILILVGIALWLVGWVVRRAVKARTEPFCIYCGYNLSGLPDHYRCPECGRPYEWRLIAEYRRDPQWFVERYRAARQLPPAATVFEAGAHRRRRRSRDGTE